MYIFLLSVFLIAGSLNNGFIGVGCEGYNRYAKYKISQSIWNEDIMKNFNVKFFQTSNMDPIKKMDPFWSDKYDQTFPAIIENVDNFKKDPTLIEDDFLENPVIPNYINIGTINQNRKGILDGLSYVDETLVGYEGWSIDSSLDYEISTRETASILESHLLEKNSWLERTLAPSNLNINDFYMQDFDDEPNEFNVYQLGVHYKTELNNLDYIKDDDSSYFHPIEMASTQETQDAPKESDVSRQTTKQTPVKSGQPKENVVPSALPKENKEKTVDGTPQNEEPEPDKTKTEEEISSVEKPKQKESTIGEPAKKDVKEPRKVEDKAKKSEEEQPSVNVNGQSDIVVKPTIDGKSGTPNSKEPEVQSSKEERPSEQPELEKPPVASPPKDTQTPNTPPAAGSKVDEVPIKVPVEDEKMIFIGTGDKLFDHTTHIQMNKWPLHSCKLYYKLSDTLTLPNGQTYTKDCWRKKSNVAINEQIIDRPTYEVTLFDLNLEISFDNEPVEEAPSEDDHSSSAVLDDDDDEDINDKFGILIDDNELDDPSGKSCHHILHK